MIKYLFKSIKGIEIDKVPKEWWWIPVNLIIIGLFFIPEKGLFSIYHRYHPIGVILFNFGQLHFLVPALNPVELDFLLIDIDYWLFGVHPTVWLESYLYPVVTEVLQIIYASFYFLPIFLIVDLHVRKKENAFNETVLAVVYCFYVSYIGYIIFPAIGPRFTIDYLQTMPLQGIWLTQDIRVLINTIEKIHRDAFPSGHTAITLVTLAMAYKYARKYFYVLIPLALAMITATVYLRYHYVIDLFAGFLLTVFIIWTLPFVYRKLSKN